MAKVAAFDFNSKEFEKGFKDIMKRVSNVITVAGMGDAIKQLHKDADDKSPKTPELTGELRKSAKEESRTEVFGKIVGVLSYNTPYAAKWHEYPEPENINWTLSGSGAKYIESKLLSFKDIYFAIIGSKIKTVL